MAVSSVTIVAPHDGYKVPDSIPRPRVRVAWTGGTGPFDVEVQWDTVSSFDSADLVTVTSIGETMSPVDVEPDTDLPDTATLWYFRARVSDGTWSSYTEARTITFNDPRALPRFHYLLANVGVAFDPTDRPTGGWGTGIGGTEAVDGFTTEFARHHYLLANVGVGFDPTDADSDAEWGVAVGGTRAPDGFTNEFNRYHYLLAHVGVGFRFKDRPDYGGTEATDWGTGIGGTWGDGDERMFPRFLYLAKNLTTDLPTPYLFRVTPNQVAPGNAFQIDGYGFMPYVAYSEGVVPTISGWSPSGGAAQFSDGHLPVQSGEDRPDVGWPSASNANPTFVFDLGQQRRINEIRVWTRLSDPFQSVTVSWSDNSPSGPWTTIGTMTPGNDGDGTGWVTMERWSEPTPADFGLHRYWRLQFTQVRQIGEIQLNRRMTVGTGDIEPRLNDTNTDWLLSISQQTYTQINAQSPQTTEPGGDVRVVNTFPDPDLVSNRRFLQFFEGTKALDTGLLVRVYDKDAPEQLIAFLPDALDIEYQELLSGIGGAGFFVPKWGRNADVANVFDHMNVVRITLDQVERWWGFITFVEETKIDRGEYEEEGTLVTLKHGNWYLTFCTLYPSQWPSLQDPTWVFENKTPGYILKTLIEFHQQHGFLSRLTLRFDESKDSLNEDWEDTHSIEFQAGTNLGQVIERLVALGIDIYLDSQFRLFAYNSRGQDKTNEPDGPVFRRGHTIEEMSTAADFENPANVAIVSYGEGRYLVYENTEASAEYGKIAGFLQSDADNATTAQRLAEVSTARTGFPLDQIAVAVIRDKGHLEPYLHYGLGDVVRIQDPTEGFDRKYRIRAITVGQTDRGEPKFVLDLNSIRLEKLIEHEIRLRNQNQNTLAIETAASTPGGAAPRDHHHDFLSGGDVEGSTRGSTKVVGWQGVDIHEGPYQNGDMWYYDSSQNMWLPVGGAKAQGRVPTIQSDGKVAWQAAGGGGGGLQVEWEDEVETGPAQDTATSGSYNRIEGVLVSLVPLFWVEAVTVYSNAAATYELVIGGKVVWTGALGVTGSGGSLVVLDEPVLLGSLPAPSTPVIWRVATATNVSLYGRDANYADDYFSMQANNPFRTVSGSGNSQSSYCPAFKIHGRPGNLDWQSTINPPT